jgi:hypothetical protein
MQCIQWALGALSPGLNRLGHEADGASPANAEVKNGGAILLLPHTSSWHSVQLKTGTTLPFYVVYMIHCVEFAFLFLEEETHLCSAPPPAQDIYRLHFLFFRVLLKIRRLGQLVSTEIYVIFIRF